MAEIMAAMAGAMSDEDGPEPGEGPSRDEREAGGYELLLIGSHADGGEVRARVTGDMDPGYGSTAKMIAESAACLVQDCPDLPGGFYTPAPSMGERLMRRLVDRAGFSFAVEDRA